MNVNIGIAATILFTLVLAVILFEISWPRVFHWWRNRKSPGKTKKHRKAIGDSVRGHLVFAISVAGLAIAILALLVNIRNGKDPQLERKRGAIDMAIKFNDGEWFEYNQFRNEAIKNHWSPKQITEHIHQDKELERTIMKQLVNFELIAVAIGAEQVDETVLYFLLGKSAIWAYDNLGDFIAERRIVRNRQYLIEFESLVDAWKVQKSAITGRSYGKGWNYYEFAGGNNGASFRSP